MPSLPRDWRELTFPLSFLLLFLFELEAIAAETCGPATITVTVQPTPAAASEFLASIFLRLGIARSSLTPSSSAFLCFSLRNRPLSLLPSKPLLVRKNSLNLAFKSETLS